MTFYFFSCSDLDSEEFINESNAIETSTSQSLERRNNRKPKNIPVFSSTELIVQFAPGTTAVQKSNLRETHGVLTYEVCAACMDFNVEKWNFGEDVDLESKLGSMEPDDDEGGVEGIINVDKEFYFEYETENYALTGGTGDTSYSSKIKNAAAPNSVTIAVLDTGVDVNYDVFERNKFLYNGSADPISEIVSGWDFVNGDDNCYDDYDHLHGTAVSSIISNALESLSVPHTILPVKVSNSEGRSSRFNIICGTAFAIERADIINMSLGWYDYDGSGADFADDILTNIIRSHESDVLVVTSAGNWANNNDGWSPNLKHYPSNYEPKNVTAIAASNHDNTDIAYFSNYGQATVDFFAPGQQIPFDGTYINGTSFSAPVVSAMAAKYLYDSGMSLTPHGIKDKLYIGGDYISASKPTLFSKLIQID